MKTLISSAKFENELAERLRTILGSIADWPTEPEISRSTETSFDFSASLPLPGRKHATLWIESKREIQPSRFLQLDQTKQLPPQASGSYSLRVLAAPVISKRVAELCAEHGWGWFDLAGNCKLSLPGPIHIERTGISAIKAPRPAANLSTQASARVLRALLAPENAGITWSQTYLKKHCQPAVSIGLINKVVRYLHDQAWIADAHPNPRGFRMHDAPNLITAWNNCYPFTRHQRTGYFTLLKPKALGKKLQELGSQTDRAAYASFSAAHFQAPYVRQSKTWLYLGDSFEAFMDLAEAKPVDSGENIVVLIPDDDGVFYLPDGDPKNRLAATNPVQTWLDLMHSGGRGSDAADAILRQCLKPAWNRIHAND